jgi:hypothetical protein
MAYISGYMSALEGPGHLHLPKEPYTKGLAEKWYRYTKWLHEKKAWPEGLPKTAAQWLGKE